MGVLNADDDHHQGKGAASARNNALSNLFNLKPNVALIAEPKVLTMNKMLPKGEYQSKQLGHEVFIAIKQSKWDTVHEWDIRTIPKRTSIKKMHVEKDLRDDRTFYDTLFEDRTVALSATKNGTINRLVTIHFFHRGWEDDDKIDVLICFLQMLWDEHTGKSNESRGGWSAPLRYITSAVQTMLALLRRDTERAGSIIVGGDFNVDLELLEQKLQKENVAFRFSVISNGIMGFVHLYPLSACNIILKEKVTKLFRPFDHPFIFVHATVESHALD